MNKKTNAALDEIKNYAMTTFRRKKIKLPRDIEWSVTNTMRGTASMHKYENGTVGYTITIPERAFIKGKSYAKYYAIHELSHVSTQHTYGEHNHCEKFYSIFLKACPIKWLEWELDYKISAIKHVEKFYCL